MERLAERRARQRLESAAAARPDVNEGLWGIQAAARQGRRVLLTQTPISYKVESFTPDEASVRIWLVTTVGVDDRQRLASFFGIAGVTLAVLVYHTSDPALVRVRLAHHTRLWRR